MDCISLDRAEQLQELENSGQPLVILKHNTTCPISKGVLQRMAASEAHLPGVDGIYVIDLLAHRELSNEIATRYAVAHQSPQLLLIRNGKCTYTEWGYDISADEVAAALENDGQA